MDDSYPPCTYDGPTQNVLLHLEALANATGQPLRLKYPLTYLDDIDTPQELTAHLDELSSVGWIASRLLQTPFSFAKELLNYAEKDSILDRNHLYSFSEDWKQALLQWFHAYQDPDTGFWGPRSRWSGMLQTRDVSNTASVVKSFVDSEGHDVSPSLRLRYKPQLFASVLEAFSDPLPAEDDLDEWHEWALRRGKGTSLLTRHLWESASEQQRAVATRLIEEYVRIKFERFFLSAEVAFSYYPGSRHATLDGTSGGVGLFSDLGVFSAERQRRLWGAPEETCADLGGGALSTVTVRDVSALVDQPKVNSITFYAREPGAASYATGAAGVFHPRKTPVLDVVELVPRVRHWFGTTSQSMGNWVSREELSDRLSRTRIEPVPVTRDGAPISELNRVLKENKALILIGFDVLQVPLGRADQVLLPDRAPRRFSRGPIEAWMSFWTAPRGLTSASVGVV
jgi:hypothetical protein